METPVHVTIWGDTNTETFPVVLVHGTMTWGTDEYFGFAAQHPLADRYRLMVMDRRGYGASPDLEHNAYASDYDIDAQDVVTLLGDGAHLVGHSYGGVVAMLAAALRPQAVRSLTLIEPGAYRAAEQDPDVAAALRQMREAIGKVPDNLSAEQWLRLSTEPVGMSVPDPTPARLRAAQTSMHERPCWEAEIPIEQLAAAAWPKLVISGTWETAPQMYREYGGKPLMACAQVVAERINARLLRVPGASHWAHWEQPEIVNSALRDLWEQ
ncbi:MAG TPA: alpha/beta hydrolase [Ktedonobacteraceae bacterium]|jgi:pimeloyl-ACP methyl ester carboxylesterase